MNDDENVVPLRRGQSLEPAPAAGMSQQDRALVLLGRYGRYGMTWAEAASELGMHHGPASGVLSHLHGQGKVARLKFETRNGQSVYVLPEHVGERTVVPRRRAASLTSEMAEMLRVLQRECVHIKRREPLHPTCKWCQVRHLLDRYDRQTKTNGG